MVIRSYIELLARNVVCKYIFTFYRFAYRPQFSRSELVWCSRIILPLGFTRSGRGPRFNSECEPFLCDLRPRSLTSFNRPAWLFMLSLQMRGEHGRVMRALTEYSPALAIIPHAG